ncbi:MAG: hypothetical protein KC466_03095, partial [Myxococcales bacterium]|nr:hypothetical protein [Myxococcales bacterium]
MTIPTTTGFDRERASADARALVLVYLYSDLGLRVFTFGPPPPLAAVEPARHDATYWHDGAIRHGQGAISAVEISDRVVDFGDLTEALGPVEGDLLASLEALERGTFTITLDNADRYFSALLETEGFLGQGAQVVVGFPDLAPAEWTTVFSGRVDRLRLTDA